MGIKENLLHVKKEIEEARLRGKKQLHTELVVVTKEHSVLEIKQVADAGHLVFGENRTQELEEKAPSFPNAKWHFIGSLQSNKAKTAVELCELIHSVDSMKLLHKINSAGRELDKVQKVLLEVNVSGEETKHGFTETKLASTLDNLKQLPFQNVSVLGLMTMAPLVEPEKTRPVFKKLFSLAQEFHMKELSMGMSNDFVVAVEEGATIVRIGTKIFQ